MADTDSDSEPEVEHYERDGISVTRVRQVEIGTCSNCGSLDPCDCNEDL